MMEWIADNKQWLFSGIGVTVLLGIWYLVRRLWSRKVVSGQEPASPPSPPESKAVVPPSPSETQGAPPLRPVTKLDMAAITKEIESRPPYQRKQARQHYIGLRFEFTGQLFSAEGREDGRIRICLHKSSGSFPLVMGNVAEATFPEIKVMHQGTSLTVQGNLTDFDSYTVTLDNLVITRYGEEPAPNQASDATSEPAPRADSSAHQG